MRENAERGTAVAEDNDVRLSRRSSVSREIRLSNRARLRMVGMPPIMVVL